MTTTVGVIANPVAGKDIRRLVAHATPVADNHKVAIVRRAVLGADDAGVDRILLAPDPRGLTERAVDGLNLSARVEVVDISPVGESSDTVVAAMKMAMEQVGALIVLGGDGTNRDVAMGWPNAPIVPISTGTNNVFPYMLEGTVAGAAAGLVASGGVGLREAVAHQALVAHAEISGRSDDLCLVDAALIEDAYLGTRAVWEADRIRELLVVIAEPWAIGLSAIAGLIAPSSRGDDRAIHLRLNPAASRRVRAPIAPGMYAEVGIESVSIIRPGDVVTMHGPAVLAFDGERQSVLHQGQTANLTVRRDGPMVIDIERTFVLAVRRGHFLSGIRER